MRKNKLWALLTFLVLIMAISAMTAQATIVLNIGSTCNGIAYTNGYNPDPVEEGETVHFCVGLFASGETVTDATLTVGGTPYALTVGSPSANRAETYAVDTAALGEGSHSFTIVATGSAGGSDSDTGTLEISADTIPPTISSIIEYYDPVDYSETIIITAEVTDDSGIASVELTIDSVGTPLTMTDDDSDDVYEVTIETTTDLGGLDVGTYGYTITATDASSNSNQADDDTGSFEVVDITSPTINDFIVTTPACYDTPIAVFADVTDNLNVNYVEIDIDGTTYRLSELSEGTYTDASAIDSSDLGGLGLFPYIGYAYDYYTAPATYGPYYLDVIDCVAPEIVDVDVDSQIEYGETFTITATITDDISGVDDSLVTLDIEGITLSDNVMTPIIGTDEYIMTIDTEELGQLSEYTFTITAEDNSEHSGPDEYTSTFEVVDTTAPEILGTPVADPDPATYGEDEVTITVTVTDNYYVDTVEITVDGTNILDESMEATDNDDEYYYTVDPVSDLAAIGEFTYTITATDTEGYIDEIEATFTVEDNTAPEITDVTVDPEEVEYGETFTISATITDDISGVSDEEGAVYVTLSDGGYYEMDYDTDDTYIASIDTSYFDGIGEYYFTITAYDVKGNSASTEEETDYFTVIDTTAPEISGDYVSESVAPVYGDLIVIGATVTDLVGVDEVSVIIDENTDDEIEYTMTNTEGNIFESEEIDTSYLNLGIHNYTIYAEDAEENEAYPPVSGLFVVIDDEYPVSSGLEATPNPVEYGSEVTFTVDVSDDIEVGVVTLYINDTEIATVMNEYTEGVYYVVIDSSDIGVGEFDYYVIATDSFFNEADPLESEDSLEIYDNEPPVVSDLYADPELVADDETVTIYATVTDNVGLDYVMVVIDGEALEPEMSDDDGDDVYELTIDASTLEVGEVTYYVVARDTSTEYEEYDEHITTASGTFEVYSTTPPVIDNVEADPETANQGEAVTINADVTDDDGIASVTLEIDGVTLSDNEMSGTDDEYSITIDTTDLDFGTYDYTVTATDSYGNEAVETGEFEIAATPPSIDDVTLSADRVDQGDVVEFTIEVSDDDSVDLVTITIDGTDIVDYPIQGSGTYYYELDTTGLELGTYYYTITASDIYGNEITTSGSFDVTIVAPIDVEIRADKTSGEEDLDVSFTAAVTGGVDDQLDYHWNFGDGNTDSNMYNMHTFTSDGTFTVTLTVEDNYGNVGSDTVTIIVGEKKVVGKDPRNNIRLRGISFDTDAVGAGESLIAKVNIENIGNDDLEDVSLTLFIEELGIWSRTTGIDVDEGDTEKKTVVLDIPYDVEPGYYDVRIVVSNDEMKRIVHRDVKII